MGQYDELVTFLNNLDDFFIEVEGKADKIKKFIEKYNSKMGTSITMQTDGICVLGNVNKWGLEFRVYTNLLPLSNLGDLFYENDKIRHNEYKYRLSNNELVKPLLYDGFCFGRN